MAAAAILSASTAAVRVSAPQISRSRVSLRSSFLHLPTPSSSSSSSKGMCHVAHAVKQSSITAESVKNIVELARRASSRREILHTDFLTPPVVNESLSALEKLSDVKAVSQGGYPQAERCRLSVGHPEIMITAPDSVAALSISGNFGFEPSSHGDFLGAILGTGIVREKLGDILLQGDKGAQVLIVPELVDFLSSTLDKVGNVSVSCNQIPLLALEYEPPRTKTFQTVEASLRIDAIASAGFKISRSKLVNLIRVSSIPFKKEEKRKHFIVQELVLTEEIPSEGRFHTHDGLSLAGEFKLRSDFKLDFLIGLIFLLVSFVCQLELNMYT